MNNVCHDLSSIDKDIDLPKFLEQLDEDPELKQYCNLLPPMETEGTHDDSPCRSRKISDSSDTFDVVNITEEAINDPLIIYERTEAVNDIVQGLRENGRKIDFTVEELRQGLTHTQPILPSSAESSSSESFSTEIVNGIADSVESNKRGKKRGSYKGNQKQSWTQTTSIRGDAGSSTVLNNTAEQKRNPMVPFHVTSLVVNEECKFHEDTAREIAEENSKKVKYHEKVLETWQPCQRPCNATSLKKNLVIVSPCCISQKLVRLRKSSNNVAPAISD